MTALPKEIEEKLRDHEEECRDYGQENINEMDVTSIALRAAIQAALEAKDREAEEAKRDRDEARRFAATSSELVAKAEKERDEACEGESERAVERDEARAERDEIRESAEAVHEDDQAAISEAQAGEKRATEALAASQAREEALRGALTLAEARGIEKAADVLVNMWNDGDQGPARTEIEAYAEIVLLREMARAALATPPRQEANDE